MDHLQAQLKLQDTGRNLSVIIAGFRSTPRPHTIIKRPALRAQTTASEFTFDHLATGGRYRNPDWRAPHEAGERREISTPSPAGVIDTLEEGRGTSRYLGSPRLIELKRNDRCL